LLEHESIMVNWDSDSIKEYLKPKSENDKHIKKLK
jgi:hypothetical protein